MMDRGINMTKAIAALSTVPMDLNLPPWRDILWNPQTKRINSKVSHLLPESILLHYVDQSPRHSDYDWLEEYRKLVKDAEAMLPV
jgi:hypothetical protein